MIQPSGGRAAAGARLVCLSVLLVGFIACSSQQPIGGIVLVVLDTTRADHLSSYGYARETTPNLDRLAREGTRYENAYAQAPWTLPSMATILTGQPPHVHGAGRAAASIFPVSALRPEVPTLAERLSSAGFATAAFTNVAWCRPESGLSRGFDHYDFRLTDESNRNHRSARDTTDAALEWMKTVDQERFLLVVHYFDPHLTYAPPPPLDKMFDEAAARIPRDFGSARTVQRVRRGEIDLDRQQRETLIARYDGELRYTDREFGRLRAGLEDLGRFANAAVVVVADHGEEFWDHGGFEHGHSHYREMLRVPLIVRAPGEPIGRVVEERVRQLDLVPTLLHLAGLPEAKDLPGVRLGEPVPYSVAEGSLWAGDLVSVVADEGTLILDRSTGDARFFATGDIAQQHPLPAESAEHLLQLLQAVPPTRRGSDRAIAPSPAEAEQLRALGYAE